VRVGNNSTDDSHWNGPADSASGAFVYIPIAESNPASSDFKASYVPLYRVARFKENSDTMRENNLVVFVLIRIRFLAH
jgi:hypothetical protein